MVLLPEPDKPVNHKIPGLWPTFKILSISLTKKSSDFTFSFILRFESIKSDLLADLTIPPPTTSNWSINENFPVLLTSSKLSILLRI